MTKGIVVVVGGGTMGRGISAQSALSGYEVRIVDVNREESERSLERTQALLLHEVEEKRVRREEALEAGLRVRAGQRPEALSGAEFVVEAVPEDFGLKTSLLPLLARESPPSALLCTNTSSLSITELSRSLPPADQRRFLGMHFFNPVLRMDLVEIVRGEETSQEAVDRARNFAISLGKEAIVVRDSPGFATTRLGVLLGLEAIRMVEEGVANPEEIDRAMVLGYRHPMGPLRLTDLVGLDVRLSIAEYLSQKLGPRFDPPNLLRQMVNEGRLGKKTGKGFYDWGEKKRGS